MQIKSIKLYWYLFKAFRNGFSLIQVLRHDGFLPHGATIDEAIFRDGMVLSHPKGRGGLIGILVEMFYENVYEIGDFYTPRPGDVVIDVGAHVGLFSVLLLRSYDCRVIAMEPCKENFACLESNLSNFDSEKYDVHYLAVGGEHGTACVETPDSTNRSHDAILNFAESSAPDSVNVVPLEDAYSLAGSDRIALLKMDIEGSEFDAFTTVSDDCLLKFDRIAMEYHDNLREGTLDLLKSRLEKSHDVTVYPDGPGNAHGRLFAVLKSLPV